MVFEYAKTDTPNRVIGGSPKSQRIEYRIAAADANPYLAAAAALGSGLIGIEQKMEPSDPIVGNSYAMKHPAKYSLPGTLMEAADRLKKSKVARDLFRANPGADSLLIQGRWRSVAYVQELEDDTSKPAVSSTAASLWWVMEALGIKVPIENYGRLLRGAS